MKLETNIESVEAEIRAGNLVIWSKDPLRILSSAVLNGGLRDANGIMNVHVSDNGDNDDEIHRDAEDFLRRRVAKLKISQDSVVGLMTAADIRNIAVTSQRYDDVAVSIFVTAGTFVSATAGDRIALEQSSIQFREFGTINIVVLIDGNLTESCMVGTVNTITEAKTVALRELDIRSRFSGDLASGTITDSVVVACTKRGKLIEYAGTATILGELICKSIKESVKEAIRKQDGVVPNRHLMKRLEERGISVAKIANLFSPIHPDIRENAEKLRQFKEAFQCALSDQNVASLVIAALRLDDDAKLGLIPETPINGCDRMSVVCEILQTAVADYLSKNIAKTDYVKFDDLGSAFPDRIGLFTRSILLAIMNGVYLKSIAGDSK